MMLTKRLSYLRSKPIALLLFFLPLLPSVLLMGHEAASAPVNPQAHDSVAKKQMPMASADILVLPEADYSGLELAVRKQLESARLMLDSLLVSQADSLTKSTAFGELGMIFNAYEFNQQAEICYQNAARLDPSQFIWSYYLARLYQETGRFEEALVLYQALEGRHTEPALLQVRLAETYAEMSQFPQAREAFLQAFYMQPGAVVVLARLGELAVVEKQYQTAVYFLTLALQRLPDANRLHYSLGLAYRGLGDKEKARAHLTKRGSVGVKTPDPWDDALEKLLRGERAYILRGRLAYAAGRYEEAVSAFRSALEFNQNSIPALVNLGVALAITTQADNAIEILKKVIVLDPDNITAHFNLAVLLMQKADFAQALIHLKPVAEVKSEDAEANLLLARAYEQTGQFEQAKGHYKKTVRINPQVADAWFSGARLLLREQNYTEALKVLEQGNKKLPDEERLAHVLAKLLAGSPDKNLRDGKRALDLALRVFQARPTAEYARTIAMAYAEQGQCEEAVGWQKKALETEDESVIEVWQVELKHYQSKDCRIP